MEKENGSVRHNRQTAFTFIDLFSGIGGFRMALENNGGVCLHFSEISTDATPIVPTPMNLSKKI